MKPNIRHIEKAELEAFLNNNNEAVYRSTQILDWLWKKHATSFEEMTNLSKPFRAKITAHFDFTPLRIHLQQIAADKTIKVIFKTWDNHFIEGVLIPTTDRKTACISSQVGCSLDCAFCATGKIERKRNLSFDEMIDQFFYLEKISLEQYNLPLTNVVFMGMGEPLLNYKHVLQSVDVLSNAAYRNFSPYRVTVSTAGVAKSIEKLGKDKVRFELAVSLHATNDEKRSKIMSINNSNSIHQILQALNSFYQQTKSKITLEYILLRGFNDSEEDALQLAALYRKAPIKLVNVIEYNAVETSPLQGTDRHKLDHFVALLTEQSVNAKVRRSRGRDIDAACGQLAAKTV